MRRFLMMLVVAALAGPAAAAEQVSCRESALANLDRGYALLHSFEYEWARLEFQTAVTADPECARAYVGEALTYNRPLGEEPTELGAASARTALSKARTAATASPRDSEFGQAVALLFQDGRSTSRKMRDRDYHEALAALHSRYPDDIEMAAFYGLSFLGLTAGRITPNVEDKEAAAELLWPYFEAGPDHPGVMHYLIHALAPTPETAERGLPVAQRYAALQPDVPHAQHMPAHVYVRLGRWEEAAEATEAADQASLALLRRLDRPPGKRSMENACWKMYVLLQRGQRERARKFMLEIKELAETSKETDAIGADVDMNYRYLVDGRRWHEAAASTPRFFWYQEVGDLAHAQALGGAFLGDRARTRQGLALLLRNKKPTVPRLQAEAALAMMEDDVKRMRSFMELALRMEDAQLARSDMPLPAIPGHELFGEMLLLMGEPEEAQEQFRISLRSRLHRPASILGLARSAAQLEQQADARARAEEFLAYWADADDDLVELDQARDLVRPSPSGADGAN